MTHPPAATPEGVPEASRLRRSERQGADLQGRPQSLGAYAGGRPGRQVARKASPELSRPLQALGGLVRRSAGGAGAAWSRRKASRAIAAASGSGKRRKRSGGRNGLPRALDAAGNIPHGGQRALELAASSCGLSGILDASRFSLFRGLQAMRLRSS